MAFFEMGKYYVTHACGKTDEAAIEATKRYARTDIIIDPVKITGEAYKYDKGDMMDGAEVTARYRYSVVDKAYWVKTDDKGGRKYVKEA